MTATSPHQAARACPEVVCDEPAAWLHGAAEALHVLSRRGPADRLRAAEHAIDLLIQHAAPADWSHAGLLAQATPSGSTGDRVPASDPAVLRMARTAMSLRCSGDPGVPGVERIRMWAQMADFFAAIVPSAEPLLRRMQATVLYQRMEVGEVSQEVIDGLFNSYKWHRDTYGNEAYLTSLTRTNLAQAYRRRATGTDLTDAEELFREEIETRTRLYGSEHPFALVARNLLARCLLAQAEAADDGKERRALALQAYDEADSVRAVRDLIYGATSANAVLSRRLQAHALLLLGDSDDLNRARARLQYVLAFETARNDNSEWRGSGQTQLLLARVCLALGEHSAALDHARSAQRLLAVDAPAGVSCRKAADLVRQLSSANGPLE